MFHFSENLYMTDAVKPEINRIKFKLYSGIGTVSVCLITFSTNENDVFDIYPASYFKQRNLRKRDFYILGVAESHSAAVKMISNMVLECLNDKTNELSIREYYLNRIKW